MFLSQLYYKFREDKNFLTKSSLMQSNRKLRLLHEHKVDDFKRYFESDIASILRTSIFYAKQKI